MHEWTYCSLPQAYNFVRIAQRIRSEGANLYQKFLILTIVGALRSNFHRSTYNCETLHDETGPGFVPRVKFHKNR